MPVTPEIVRREKARRKCTWVGSNTCMEKESFAGVRRSCRAKVLNLRWMRRKKIEEGYPRRREERRRKFNSQAFKMPYN